MSTENKRSQRGKDLNKMTFKLAKAETGNNQMNGGELKQAINLIAKLYASDDEFKQSFLRYAGEFHLEDS